MEDINKLNITELKSLLKDLKLLNSLEKNMGKYGKREFNNIKSGLDVFKIEYFDFGEDSRSYFKENTTKIFKELFGIDVDPKDVDFKVNQNIKGGFKVFYNDYMFDISYLRFEKMFK